MFISILYYYISVLFVNNMCIFYIYIIFYMLQKMYIFYILYLYTFYIHTKYCLLNFIIDLYIFV